MGLSTTDELLAQAESGECDAQLKVAENYSEGAEGFKKDDVEAVRWFLAASEQGCADAQLLLAKCFAQGKGVEVRLQSAVYWCVVFSSRSIGHPLIQSCWLIWIESLGQTCKLLSCAFKLQTFR